MSAPERPWRRLWRALRWGEDARKAERQRVAADLHDGPLQSVIGLQMRLEAARTLIERDPSAARQELSELARLATEVVAELRVFLREMRPPPLKTTELGALARTVAEDFTQRSGIPVRFDAVSAGLTVTPETCLELAQILREALHNVRKHAGASRVEVALRGSTRGAEVVVADDGAGFPFSGTFTLDELDRQGLGPASIRERVRKLGGAMTLESRPGQGARLTIRIPA